MTWTRSIRPPRVIRPDVLRRERRLVAASLALGGLFGWIIGSAIIAALHGAQ